jgi:hypothetical protein
MPHIHYEKVKGDSASGKSFIDRGVARGAYHHYAFPAAGLSGVESDFSRELEIPPPPEKSEGGDWPDLR